MTKTTKKGLFKRDPLVIEKRFLAKIRESKTGCWLWIGSVKWNGYGEMHIDGRNISTHHVSWMLYRGQMPETDHILHTCDVRRCANPEHLFTGTDVDNMEDAAQKRRMSRTHQPGGVDHVEAKLTTMEVKEIRMLGGQIAQRKLAAQYEVSQRAIWNVLHRKSYREVA